LRGTSPDAEFRADRALGNMSRNELTLVGNVVAHTSGSARPSERAEPLTMLADQVRMAAKDMTATGHVRVEQDVKSASTGQTVKRTLQTENITYNTDNGDLSAPAQVSGEVDQGAFRADSLKGNTRVQEFDLNGHVRVTRTRAAAAKATASKPVTLSADHLKVSQRTKLYVATGSVKLTQGDRTVGAPIMRLDDNTHVATLTGGVHATQADRVGDTSQLSYHTDTGEFIVPTELKGHSKTDTFRADHASGNANKAVYTLEGHVHLARSGGFGKADTSKQDTVLDCDQFRIESNQKLYTASGHPKLTQGQRTMTGQTIFLDDNTHLVHVTGGAHAEQPPNRKFDAPELVYDTQTDVFKATGGVTVTFPVQRATPTPTPTPKGKKGASPAPSVSPTAAPSPTPAPSPSA
jgi:lipopolysaccharide assembly outer membrane protein LptD (OstA)